MVIIRNPDAVQRIFGRGKKKRRYWPFKVVFHGLIGQFRTTNPSYFGCSYWHLQLFHLFWKSSF